MALKNFTFKNEEAGLIIPGCIIKVTQLGSAIVKEGVKVVHFTMSAYIKESNKPFAPGIYANEFLVSKRELTNELDPDIFAGAGMGFSENAARLNLFIDPEGKFDFVSLAYEYVKRLISSGEEKEKNLFSGVEDDI